MTRPTDSEGCERVGGPSVSRELLRDLREGDGRRLGQELVYKD